jgi:hypothetical protein
VRGVRTSVSIAFPFGAISPVKLTTPTPHTDDDPGDNTAG